LLGQLSLGNLQSLLKKPAETPKKNETKISSSNIMNFSEPDEDSEEAEAQELINIRKKMKK